MPTADSWTNPVDGTGDQGRKDGRLALAVDLRRDTGHPRPVHERVHGFGRRHRAGDVLAGPQDGEGLPQVPHCVRGDRP
ncbi:hypothetical protein [Streptomyces microflavus]|uniref:hypothetical protein n=1 Tax=Streptomyces microflavus TaxID=1919 RepID=UPI0005C71415|nr:hypothetical protein [Streptomyces microflavus]